MASDKERAEARSLMDSPELRGLFRRTYAVFRLSDPRLYGWITHRSTVAGYDSFLEHCTPLLPTALQLFHKHVVPDPDEFLVDVDYLGDTYVITDRRLFLVHGRDGQTSTVWWKDVAGFTRKRLQLKGGTFSLKMKDGAEVTHTRLPGFPPEARTLQAILDRRGNWGFDARELEARVREEEARPPAPSAGLPPGNLPLNVMLGIAGGGMLGLLFVVWLIAVARQSDTTVAAGWEYRAVSCIIAFAVCGAGYGVGFTRPASKGAGTRLLRVLVPVGAGLLGGAAVGWYFVGVCMGVLGGILSAVCQFVEPSS